MPDRNPAGRPIIHLPNILVVTDVSPEGKNPYRFIELGEPKEENYDALLNGMRRILPSMYRSYEEILQILDRHGMNFAANIPFPTSYEFQIAHLGEFLICTYFEELEQKIILTYKWRLNTTRNQHQYGMDLLAFDFEDTPPKILAIAVKTTRSGGDGRTPTVFYSVVNELHEYFASAKLDDDLEVIAANLHSEQVYQETFLEWYDPYTLEIPSVTPRIVAIPAIVLDENNWDDRFANPVCNCDLGEETSGRFLVVPELEKFVREVFSTD